MNSNAIPIVAPGIRVGIDEATVQRVVHKFYGHIREDTLLGPIFNGAVHDWDNHLARMCDFWSSVLLMSGRYKGTPMPLHAAIDGLAKTHFERWLTLFRITLAETGVEGDAGTLFLRKAEQIGESLLLGVTMIRSMRNGGTRPN